MVSGHSEVGTGHVQEALQTLMRRSLFSNGEHDWTLARARLAARAAFCALLLAAGAVAAEDAPISADRQALEDAWWTGPIIAAGATPLPKGHVLVEPYVYDVIRYGYYDTDGDEQDASRIDSWGSLTYALYGLTDNFTVGIIPTFGFNEISDGTDSSGIKLGDLSLQAQYGLTRFKPGKRVPTMSLVLQQSCPSGNTIGSATSRRMAWGAVRTRRRSACTRSTTSGCRTDASCARA
jgi:hypothetical protein